MNKKHKKTCETLSYNEHFFLFVSAVTGSVSISEVVSLVCISIAIKSSAVGIRICVIADEIKKV